ncbi:hypothetical protein [Streptomyces sp. NPDC057623]|uniref:hypothetical protein n=1 Tax=Streptomyces sp. NPDC057623 TaxID=3346187 RepID=UPI0036A35CDE
MDATEIFDLPYIDTHTSLVAASPDAVWRALGETFDHPGFHVVTSVPGRELALAGSHRFSTYVLVFRLEEAGADRTRVEAESRAAFPGATGRLYRLLVIGTRGHAWAVRRMVRKAGEDALEGRGAVSESGSATGRDKPPPASG